MENKGRTQLERSAATKGQLIQAARRLWARHGYANIGTPEIARDAGVTRGALYHQFASKEALFAEVAETVERDVTQRLVDDVIAKQPADPLAALHHAVDAWLDACADQEVRQILLIDAPTVLGWEAFRDLAASYGLGLTEQLLTAAIDAQLLPDFTVAPFAHILLGALQESAFAIAADPTLDAPSRHIVHGIIDAVAATSAPS